MICRIATILSVAWLASSGIAHAEDAGCIVGPPPPRASAPEVPAAIVMNLVGWIALTTDYDVSLAYNDPPKVLFCDIGDEVGYEGTVLPVEKGLLAAFDLPNRTIHLVRPWSAEDLFDTSVLLHELIHDIQYANRDWDCTGAPEWEAYRLQDVWLRQHGMHYDFNWLAIYALSRCPEDPNL